MSEKSLTELDTLAVATIRSTVVDVVNKAKSGHPGMALGSAPILYTLFKNHIISNPEKPYWCNRDRFVLSAGHASALLYTMLHLCGYGVTMSDLQKFRQLDSLTPGHPEFHHTLGVDATSGPLGQGIAQAVGMAMAEQATQAQYPDGDKLISHYTYCLCGDGCLEEGLSQEAISLAGRQKLSKLVLIYDANGITLDGSLEMSFSENVRNRFLATGWDVFEVKDGNNLVDINKAIEDAKKTSQPSLVIVHTIIGFGSLKQGTNKVHGNPLGEEDGKHAKVEVFGFNHEDFFIPQEVYKLLKDTFAKRGLEAYENWQKVKEAYDTKYPEAGKLFNTAFNGDVNSLIFKELPEFVKGSEESTRVTSGKALNLLHSQIPFLMGGSADVAGSVMTAISGGTNFEPGSRNGRNINWGIREFAMASAQNGMLLHGGLKTYGGCFLVFADYLKAAVRLAALSKLPAIYLFSHDSIAVGEDGPTHQPIEQLVMLRSIPNVNVIRPCDQKETYASWKLALLSKDTPTALILSRQNLPLLEGSSFEGVKHGGYVIKKEQERIDATIIATGSEVSLAVEAQYKLLSQGIDVRVVSMPSTFLFDKQPKEYMEQTLGIAKSKVIAVEMLSTLSWYKYADTVMGIDTFGTSAPAKDAINKFDFTSDHLVKVIKGVLNK